MEVEGLEFEVVEVETVQVELEMKANCLKHHLGKNWVLLVHQPLLWPSLLPLPFLGGLSLHLNHLIGSRVTNYDWPFGTLPLGLFWSNLDTMDLETYPRSYSDHF